MKSITVIDIYTKMWWSVNMWLMGQLNSLASSRGLNLCWVFLALYLLAIFKVLLNFILSFYPNLAEAKWKIVSHHQQKLLDYDPLISYIEH